MEEQIITQSQKIIEELKKDFCKDDALAVIEITKILIKNADVADYVC